MSKLARILSLLIVTVMLGGMLAACGQTVTPDPTEPPAVDPVDEPEPTEEPEPVDEP